MLHGQITSGLVVDVVELTRGGRASFNIEVNNRNGFATNPSQSMPHVRQFSSTKLRTQLTLQLHEEKPDSFREKVATLRRERSRTLPSLQITTAKKEDEEDEGRLTSLFE